MRPATILLLRLAAWLEGIRIKNRRPLDLVIPAWTTSWRWSKPDGSVYGDAMQTETSPDPGRPPRWHLTWALLSGLSSKANATEFANVRTVPAPWQYRPPETKRKRSKDAEVASLRLALRKAQEKIIALDDVIEDVAQRVKGVR
jgi:hypothetical protein